MNAKGPVDRKARAVMEKIGLSYEQLIGLRFALNVFIGTTIVWIVLKRADITSPIWAIASLIAASDPDPAEARRMFKARLINVIVGGVVGMAFILTGVTSPWLLPIALSVTVLISMFVVRVKTMWRQAPITVAIIIASTINYQSDYIGYWKGLYKVGEVIFGCVVGMLVSMLMDRLWLVRPPANGTGPA